MVQYEVDDFVSLARSGAYLGGNRRVSPRERSRWRFTFKRLADEAQDALRTEDAGPAASALERLIDLACEAHDYDYFRSDDPVAAAGFVVSDVAAVLWAWTWERHGFRTFAESAAPQLIRWESSHGWTRYGEGPVAAKETSLAVALAHMLALRTRGKASRSSTCGRLMGCATAAHRRAEYDIPPPGPSRNGRGRWRNGTASCWKILRTPMAACSTGSPGTPLWAVRSRRLSPHGSRTDAATAMSPAT